MSDAEIFSSQASRAQANHVATQNLLRIMAKPGDLSSVDGHMVHPDPDLQDAVMRRNPNAIKTLLTKDPGFDQMKKEAYSSHDGYSIRYNPLTGKREMFVAGTKPIGHGQWALNALDLGLQTGDWLINQAGQQFFNNNVLGTAISEHFGENAHFPQQHLLENIDIPRKRKTKYLEQIAKDNHIEVIYGHSRGGALLADMKVPGAKKVGLDAAMILTHNKELLNINEGGADLWHWRPTNVFDGFLGATGRNNLYFDGEKGTFHQVWSSNP